MYSVVKYIGELRMFPYLLMLGKGLAVNQARYSA